MNRVAMPGKVAILLAVSTAAFGFDDAAGKKAAKEPSVASLIRDLSHDKYRRREAAVKKLTAVGQPAIAPLTKVALTGGVEESARALTILGAFLDSPKPAIALGAIAALRKVARSMKPAAAKKAVFLLRRPNRLVTMAKLAGDVKLSRPAGNQPLPVPLVKKAGYRFSDPGRTHLDGTFWVWADQGRPAAVAELWTNRGSEADWFFGFVSLSPTPLSAEIGQGPPWQPQNTDTRFADIRKAPRPAPNAKQRLKQMRELAARFRAHEIGDPNRTKFDLKLHPEPVYRYQDANLGLVDGGLFLICHAGNPEVVLMIETHQPKKGAAVWKYAVARASSAELHLVLDGQEVWSCPGANPIAGKPNGPYRIRHRRFAGN